MSPGSFSAAASVTATPAGGAATAVPDCSRYVDEDLSFLDFGGHVVFLAENEDLPPLERIHLLAASGGFLDNFFQLRGAGLRASAAGRRGRPVRVRLHDLYQRQAVVEKRLTRSLAAHGVGLCDLESLGQKDRGRLREFFGERLLPVLAPLVTEPGQPLPPPANLSLNLAVTLTDGRGTRRFGSVELPPVVPRFVPLPEGRLVPVEQVVGAHLAALFPGFVVEGHAAFRVTREAGVPAPRDTEDLLASLEAQLGGGLPGGRPGRDRSNTPVRLEIEPGIGEAVLRRLLTELDLGGNDVYMVRGLLALADLRLLARTGRPEREPLRSRPVAPARLSADVFGGLRRQEMLVHPPYDSFASTVGAFAAQAARDPDVMAIKQTLYRPTPDGAAVRALVRAAEGGKHVVALVELTARLGERDSVACARLLERAGAHVVYGLVGLRTHANATLVVRRRGDAVERYSVLSTGSHHPERAPEGLTLLSADPTLGADLGDLFNYLTGYSRPADFRRLVVGPGSLRPALLDLIRGEAAVGSLGSIRIKVNRLVDREMIDELYAASQRGARVDLVVGGACALRPGVAGLSPTIRVVAGSGRHAQTSRIFGFGSGDAARWYLSSADLARNDLDRHVNVAVSVDGGAMARLEQTLEAHLASPAWALGPDGAWRRAGPGAEDILAMIAASAAGGTPAATLGP